MKVVINMTFLLFVASLLTSCDLMRGIERKAAEVNSYEKKSLGLAKENRELKSEISHLNYKVQAQESENAYLKLQLKELKKGSRGIASVAPFKATAPKKNVKDFVKFDVYKWKAKDLLKTAEKEFNAKNFEKSAQFYSALIKNYPRHAGVDDIVLFQAGLSGFEAGKDYHKSISHFSKLIKKYPSSKFYRGAKLWIALSNLKIGNQDAFFSTVEEFRQKYRNTPEWRILSDKYEEIVEKYKN